MSRKPDEPGLRLWREITRQITPLKSTAARLKREAARAALCAPLAPAPAPAPEKLKQPKQKAAAPAMPSALPMPVSTRPAEPPPERRGRIAGVDRRTAERLRRGQYPIDGRLDLHGLTRELAHMALRRFVRSGQAEGRRCLLVITGKGLRERPGADGSWMAPEQPGVLRREVPRWLSERDLAPLVLATAPAIPPHGGSGAMYILLRRQRE
ncbi:MAG: Smr/MutS family protein [Pseudomonadota bacterium]|nr:Smr/MutS family protein [Pseudomonadota bacterium]